MMISGSSNNHKNHHGQVGQEVAARSPDAPAVPDDVENGGQEVDDRLPPTGLATNNHPEEPENESIPPTIAGAAAAPFL